MQEAELPPPAPPPPKPTLRRRARALRWLKIVPLLVVAALVVRQRFFVPVAVRATQVTRGEVTHEVFGRGTVESRRDVQLGFDLVGRISDLLVDEGDHVKLGQVLGHLAPEQFTTEAATANAGVNLAKSAGARLDAEDQKLKATLDFATGEEQRVRALSAAGVVSPRDLDLAVQQLALAHAEVDRLRAARDEAKREIAVASGTVAIRNVAVARSVLVSPFDGIVVRRSRDPGDTVTVGTSVLRVVATDALWSRAWIDEAALPLLREGQIVRIRLGAEGEPTLSGTVDRIGREVDRQTHELLVDVLISAPPQRIAIGQRADVWIATDRHADVSRIASSLVRREAGAPFVYRDIDGRIGRVNVKLGLTGIDTVEVEEGLSPGDSVLESVEPGSPLGEGRKWARAAP